MTHLSKQLNKFILAMVAIILFVPLFANSSVHGLFGQSSEAASASQKKTPKSSTKVNKVVKAQVVYAKHVPILKVTIKPTEKNQFKKNDQLKFQFDKKNVDLKNMKASVEKHLPFKYADKKHTQLVLTFKKDVKSGTYKQAYAISTKKVKQTTKVKGTFDGQKIKIKNNQIKSVKSIKTETNKDKNSQSSKDDDTTNQSDNRNKASQNSSTENTDNNTSQTPVRQNPQQAPAQRYAAGDNIAQSQDTQAQATMFSRSYYGAVNHQEQTSKTTLGTTNNRVGTPYSTSGSVSIPAGVNRQTTVRKVTTTSQPAYGRRGTPNTGKSTVSPQRVNNNGGRTIKASGQSKQTNTTKLNKPASKNDQTTNKAKPTTKINKTTKQTGNSKQTGSSSKTNNSTKSTGKKGNNASKPGNTTKPVKPVDNTNNTNSTDKSDTDSNNDTTTNVNDNNNQNNITTTQPTETTTDNAAATGTANK